jgi:hypothetical protein
MVMAKSFRGPECDRFALALVLELKRDYGLPAYILRSKDLSRIQNAAQPAAMNRAPTAPPENVRRYDEAIVLVGNARSIGERDKLCQRVKKIKPKCLEQMPKIWAKREGLSNAMGTTNPFSSAQSLFPSKHDPLIARMNDGPRSILQCPGRYSLQVADFSGRATFNVDGAQVLGDVALKNSPLQTAHEDAEKLANALANAEEIRRLGQPVYVYHDRTSSKVLIGAFNAPNDPNAVKLHDDLLRMAVEIMDTKYIDRKRPGRRRGIDKMIAPPNYLTDVDSIRQN